MGLRPRRRNVVVWSSSAVPAGLAAGRRGASRPRIRWLRWWLRTGALLAIIGVLRLARAVRDHWEPVLLGAGTVLTVTSIVLPAAVGAFFPGLLVLIVTLLRGVARNRGYRPGG